LVAEGGSAKLAALNAGAGRASAGLFFAAENFWPFADFYLLIQKYRNTVEF
jgi:hypothetical protein